MSLIPCDDHCIYQKDGYCMLETPGIITNQEKNGCVHQINPENLAKQVISSKLQKLP